MYGRLKCIKKRSGLIQDFDILKLQKTILVTIEEEKEFQEPLSVAKNSASRLSFEVVTELEKLIKSGKVDPLAIDADVIQDSVENVFYDSGYHNTAKNYMKYKFDKQLKRKDEYIKTLEIENRELKDIKEKYIDDRRHDI